VALALAGYAWERAPVERNEAVARFELTLVGDPSGASEPLSSIAMSPDGRTIAFVATSERQIFLRRLDDVQVTPVPSTGGAYSLAFSPDGNSIAFVTRSKGVRVVRLADHAITSLVDSPGGENITAAWFGDDQIVLTSPDPEDPTRVILARIPATGGQRRRLCRPNEATGEHSQLFPYPLHGRDIVLYTSVGVNGAADLRLADVRLAVCDTKRGTTRLLGESGREIVGVLENRLIFVRSDGTLMGVPFDERSALLRGAPTRLVDGVQLNFARAAVALSATGTLAYVTGSPSSQLVLVSGESTPTPLGVERRAFRHPRVSPDGRRIAVDITGKDNIDVWVYDTVSRTVTRLTSDSNNARPEWTPDGRRVVFISDRDANRFAIWWQLADGSGGAEKVFASANPIREVIPTPDGQALVFREDHPERQRDIYLLPLTGRRSPVPILTTEADELMPRLSPDGRWLAYQSDESGRPEIYLRSFPGPGARVQVSANGGTEPMWARDGRRLFYRSNRSVIAASLQMLRQAAPDVTARDVVADGDYLQSPYDQQYDVTPDGRTLLMLTSSANGARFVVVLNWLRELRAKVQ
jgi:serine/threonine-protein kinase